MAWLQYAQPSSSIVHRTRPEGVASWPRTSQLDYLGSLRKGSFNSARFRAAAELVPPGGNVTIASVQPFPLYNGNDETANGIPIAVLEMTDADAVANGLRVVTPENNNGTPSVVVSIGAR